MLLRLYCFFLLLFSGNSLWAASKSGKSLRLDTTQLTLRHFDEDALARFKVDTEFQYGEVSNDAMPGWWLDFWRWLWSLFSDVKVDPSEGAKWWPVIKYALIAVCVGILVFAILKVLGMDLRFIFSRKPKTLDLPYSETLENIHEISFDEELEKAIMAKNYRLAVRLLYLKCLKALNDAGRIKWEIDKTNSQYISEMKHLEQQKQFSVLTQQFEFVWYGGFEVNENSFNKIRDRFSNFNILQR